MSKPGRALLLPLLVIACVAGPAIAQDISTNLSWDHCVGDGRIADRTFACNTNSGEDVLVLSFVLHDSTRTGFAALGVKVDFTPVAASVPSWWRLLSGQCRANAVSMSFDWSDPTLPPSSCLPWHGPAAQLSVLQYKYGPADRFYADAGAAVPAGQEQVLLVGQEYLIARIKIRRSKTVGTGACEGCGVPVCIGFSQLLLQYPGNHPYDYVAGAGLNTVTWQGGYVASYPTTSGRPCSHPSLCPYVNRLECTLPPVPARGQTWGVIKTLYR